MEKHINICLLCGKPFKKRGDLCVMCNKKKKKLEKQMTEKTGYDWVISNRYLLYAMEKTGENNIIDYFLEDTNRLRKIKYNREISKNVAAQKRTIKEYNRSAEFLNENEYKEIPYIRRILGEYKEPIRVYGRRTNPCIIYRCKRCNEEFEIKFFDLQHNAGHMCSDTMSMGERKVKDYLDFLGEKYKTQKQTLKCINPDTGSQLPYDFELEDKIIIEVQGNQHLKFTPIFHGTEDGFKYQQKKDKIKKEFAIQQGYHFLEIFYDEFDNEIYKDKIFNAIESALMNQ